MIVRLSSLFTAFLVGCTSPNTGTPEPRHAPRASSGSAEPAALLVVDSLPDEEVPEYADLHVVVADTGSSYQALHAIMLALSEQFGIPIDTMGRGYLPTKDLIALPEDDEDELYAGDYFPRRFPSDGLSLEYLAHYNEDAGSKTIALVAGIHEARTGADSVVALLRSAGHQAYRIEARLYLGCLH